MANIFTDLKKKLGSGYTHIDEKGDFRKREQLEKQAYSEYNKAIRAKIINPLNLSFHDYFEEYSTESMLSIEELIGIIEDVFLEEEEETEPPTDLDELEEEAYH